jgi:hypothetical protein
VASLTPRKFFASNKHEWYAVGFISLLIALGLAILAPIMAPIKHGDRDQFWKIACEVDIEGKFNEDHGYVYKPREGCFAYEVRYLVHRGDMYWISQAEADASFDQIVERLQAGEGKDADRPHVRAIRAGFEKWLNRPEIDQHNSVMLLTDIREAYLNSKRIDNPDFYANTLLDEMYFERCWARSKWYWADVAFEWIFLSGLVLIAAWPTLHNKTWWRWAIHLSLLPMLFMLPFYLGYADFTFSSYGPSGGVLYPWLLIVLPRGECNQFDRLILEHTPQILEPLAAPVGTRNAITWKPFPGPTTMAIAGLVIALLVFCAHKLVKWDKSRRSRRAGGTRKSAIDEPGHC